MLSGDLESAAQALKRGWGAAARKIEQGSDNTVKQQAKQKEPEQFTKESTSPKYTKIPQEMNILSTERAPGFGKL